MVQSLFNTSALFEGSMIPQMAYSDWSWNVFTFAFPRTSKFSSNRSYATLSPQNPNITWKALLWNLAFKRAFSRYARKMALASASSYTQFFAVCTSGNGEKVQTWFFKVQNYSETSDCLFLHEKKTCQNVPTVLKCRTKSTPYLPFHYLR